MLSLMLLVFLTKVPPDLAEVYQKAAWAWLPFQTLIKEVRTCDDFTCPQDMLIIHGVAYWDGIGKIYIKTDHPLRSATKNWDYLNLIHEYGHALGLWHNGNQDSVMFGHWAYPVGEVATKPSERDFEAIKKMFDN